MQTDQHIESLHMPLICSSSNDKKEEVSSLLSVSNDLPQPKRKILLSMEVITEEKIKETGDSFNSSNDKNDKKIEKFLQSEADEKPTYPVSSQASLTKTSNSPKANVQPEEPGPKGQGMLISNKKKKPQKTKSSTSHTNENNQTTSISLKNICTESKNVLDKPSSKTKSRGKFKSGSSKNIKESEYALSFSSGTNLTQTTFDFGFSKVVSCECSVINKTGGNSKCSMGKKTGKAKNGKICSLTNIENETNFENKKNIKKKAGKSKKKNKRSSQKNKKCGKCGKRSSEGCSKNSNLQIPNFIVQPFNKFEVVLEPRNYDLDQRGTLGKEPSFPETQSPN